MNNNKKQSRILISHAVKVKGKEISFFIESNKNDKSVTELTEKEVVKWIFENEDRRELIFNSIYNLKTNEHTIKLEVKEPLLNKNDQKIIGDIDAVIVPNNYPEKTSIIEFKRVKVKTELNGAVITNKIQKLRKKGFDQIKKLRKFNYHKTYLGVIIEDDARYVKSPNTISRKSKDEIVNAIFNINSDNSLESKAGLFFIKLIQPTGESVKVRYNFEIIPYKEAEEIKQNKEITEKIKELLENKDYWQHYI